MAESFELVSIDNHFGSLLSRLAETANPNVFLAGALASMATRNGHACLDLSAWSGREVAAPAGVFRCPELPVWAADLAACPAVGDGAVATPLVLEGDRLYLHRYWEYENDVARFVVERSREPNAGVAMAALAGDIARLFPDPVQGCDWQRLAALAVALRTFVVITGGPGTGKTTTVAKIIALLLEHSGGGDNPRIALAAPTGKAVMRLQAVMAAIRKNLSCADLVKARIPTTVFTLHRLLGPRRDSPFFVHDENNRLPYDLVVIDEASMVDLPLMAKLMRALRPGARLVLLGDRNQLASVEPGAVLGDICHREALPRFSAEFIEAAAPVTAVADLAPGGDGRSDSLVELRVSHRFGKDSGIGLLGRAISRGDTATALGVFRDARYSDLVWRDVGDERELQRELADRFGRCPPGWFGVEDPAQAAGALGRSQVLCAVRHGAFGVNRVNLYIEKVLAGQWGTAPGAAAYRGRPVMVVENNYEVQLFNGDTGLVLADSGNGEALSVFFPTGDGGVRKIPLAMLPAHETAYAMTVHKSQGSEFNEIVVILPDRRSPVLTRELLYTALTRARHRVEVWGGVEVFADAVQAVIGRYGGLGDKLAPGRIDLR
ncbi:MAG: exodeoxyribonuclease V subunit alpha [Desulfurivibrionaceae bacterium]|nr:exodeoxyribonuclease V subunit alpha [Desulfobulbales bacterium]MDT8335703.1 exodeoxyribonuclease V subunit alpha [Desulfurivibrionaceae bacterium]